MRRLVVALAFAALLLCVTSVWSVGSPMLEPPDKPGPGAAPPGGPGPMPPQGGMVPRMGPMDTMSALVPPPPPLLKSPRLAEDLKLTDDQKSKIYGLIDQFLTDQPKLTEKVREGTRTIREALTDPGSDKNKIDALISESGKAEAAVIARELDLWMKIRSILSADQLRQLAQHVSGPGPGPMPPGGGPTPPGGAPPPGGMTPPGAIPPPPK